MKNITTYTIETLSLTGIYSITCKTNNKIYIGSAAGTKGSKRKIGFYRRWYEHIDKLNNNKHANKHLQNAWNKYGQSDFEFNIIEFCAKEECENKELYYINYYDSTNHNKGFNIIKQSNFHNFNFTNEHKEKISKALKGKKRPLDVVKKWSKKVQQLDKNFNVINEFYSMSEASRITGIQRQDIGQSIIGKKCKTAGGYYWKIVEDIV